MLFSVPPFAVTLTLDNSCRERTNIETLPDLIQHPGIAYK
ncbi:hypothetical protein MAHJHV50_50610 [Mycobacterium avium subsp. hominissuis]